MGLRILKRFFNIIFSCVGICFLTPVLIVISIIIRLTIGLPVLFCQTRSGYKGQPFVIYKFRTMVNTVDELGNLLPDEKRLTKFGKFLRNTSIDELPTLFNVIKGYMNLVGPRPLLVAYFDRYTPEQKRRLDVKPGITGWAQVNGRNAISWEDKFKLDVWYVDNQSFYLDIKILFLTIIKVFRREGISKKGHVTMPEFKGTIDE